MKNPGIHARLLIAVSVLIGSTTFALGYMGTHMIRKFVQTRFEERISFLTKYLALNAELGILIEDKAMLQSLAANLLSVQDVAEVMVLDKSGGKLALVSKETEKPFSVIDVPVVLSRSLEISQAFQWSKNGGDEDALIGRVRVVYSTGGIEHLLKKMKDNFMWLSSGLGLLAAIIFYFLSHSLVAPLTRLAQAARDVERGNREIRVHLGSLPETRELASAFNAMLDSLEWSSHALEDAYQEMIQQKSLAEMGKFSMMVAHEVKNPLSIIKSSLDLLKKDMAIPPDNTMVAYMEDEIRRLSRLIEDFLTFSRPVRPTFRRVEINSLMAEIITRFELQQAGSHIVISAGYLAEACYISADPDLLIRLFDNLLKNASEANDYAGGTIFILLFRQRELVCIDVADEGSGIETEHIENIFDPFFTTRSKGTGLGLAYVNQVVRMHGGSVTAKNREEGGALFRVSLPVTFD